MGCEACGGELDGRASLGTLHRACVERLLSRLSDERLFRSDQRTSKRDST